jgi:cobalamin biosynthesis Mg chelatase CobN
MNPSEAPSSTGYIYEEEVVDEEEYEEEIIEEEEESSSSDDDDDDDESSEEEEVITNGSQSPQSQSSQAAAGVVNTRSTTTSTTSPSVKKNEQRITFPSSGLLFCIAFCILAVTAGIVTGVTIYAREKKVFDPLPVPTVSPAPTSPGETRAPTMLLPTTSPTQSPTLSQATFLELFETVVGPDVYVEGSTANLAAQWMLTEDPQMEPLNFNSKSEEAWLQRYLLVYLYYATTDNRNVEWLSCNPPIFAGSQTTDCEFANPTELPGGRLVYDRVPSNQWLSAADECNWAGITCQTVSDPVMGGRLAVTSILLGTFRLGEDLGVWCWDVVLDMQSLVCCR